MKNILITLSFLVLSFAINAKDRLEVYEDYDIGKEIMVVTTVKVDPNMGDVYLAGLKDSWVKAVKIQKELGYIKDWKIYGSDMPNSGNFNMLLIVTFNNSADLEPSKKKYDAFMKKWSEADEKMSNEISAKYPEVRTITGEYQLREIMMK
ncbi:hypothetical protein [Arsukibacterium sp. UBA3155]|uniref:hypothetical protein n=1 Tax=Arsukibacterium sp. UBA3155 TaxID=1946058 RepID=UPI0025C6BBF0|nr:hypothetical protein [Arsukibacterium sp. UBA3155]|tara:strand:- start:38883 stop:39332 length:450 start_codon:yes stop_codon:yes gene_type:complete